MRTEYVEHPALPPGYSLLPCDDHVVWVKLVRERDDHELEGYLWCTDEDAIADAWAHYERNEVKVDGLKIYHLRGDYGTPEHGAILACLELAIDAGQVRTHGKNGPPLTYGMTVVAHPNQCVGFAFCSKKDQFCRRRGREIAIGRCLRSVGRPKKRGDVEGNRVVLWGQLPKLVRVHLPI